MRDAIYLDYQATTPLAPDVLAAMMPYLSGFIGNPHSILHRAGRAAKAAVELARDQVSTALGVAPETIIFTSGATEANNLALRGVMELAPPGRRRLITVATEHRCVLDTALDLRARGHDVTVLPVQSDGLVDISQFQAALGVDVALVSVMAVNNEIGVIQPLSEIARLAHAAGALVHSDCAQAFTKIPLSVSDFDLASFSGHKIYGPGGIGALYVRSGVALRPQMTGGGQEAGLRSGTLSPALCAGMGAAAVRAAAPQAVPVRQLFDAALAALADCPVPWHLNGSTTARYFGNLNICFPGIDSARLIADVRSVMLSTGAACAASAGRQSHVLAALGLSDADVASSVRVGFGESTSMADVATAFTLLNQAILQQRGQRP